MSLIAVSCSLLFLGNITRFLVDNVIVANNYNHMNVIIKQAIAVIIIFAISSFLRSFFINNVSENIILDIRYDVFNYLLTLQVHSFEKLKVSDISTRLASDIESTGKIIVDLFSFIIRSSIMLIGGIILMFTQSNKLSFLVIIMLIIIILPMVKVGHYIRTLSRTARSKLSKIYSETEELLNNIKLVYSFNQQKYRMQLFNSMQQEYFICSKKRLKMRAIFFSVTIALIMYAIAFIIWVGSNDVITGTISSGQLVSFIYYSIIVAASLGGITEIISEFPRYFTAAERVFNLFEITTTELGRNIAYINNLDNTMVQFNDVTFSYPSRPDIKVLLNFNLSINPNQFVAIVGKSGSGKSTILQLLMRFFTPVQGNLKIGGIDISLINLYQLRQYFSYVPQDSYIFSDTIKNNILFSNPSASKEDILHAIRISMVDEFLSKMPDNLDSFVGEKGIALSGGQKQRIAIARGLITNAKIILLDESTNALDSKTEKIVLTNIRNMYPLKTIVVVTHRISAIEQQADNIIVLDKGQVINQGKHFELIQKCPLYNQLALEEDN